MYGGLVMKLVKDNIVKITDDPVKIEKLIELGYELTGVEIVEETEDNKAEDKEAEDKEAEDNKAENKEADEVVNEETEAVETAEAAEKAEKAEVKKTKKTTSNKK